MTDSGVLIRLEGHYYFVDDEIPVAAGVPNDADVTDQREIDGFWIGRVGIGYKF